MAEPASQGVLALLLSNRNLAAFIAGRFLLNCANQMQTVAISWVLYNMTDSALSLGYVGLTQFLPSVLLVLVTGQVADRYERRLVLAVTLFVQSLCAGALTYLVIGEHRAVWAFYLVLTVLGVARAFAYPAFQAMLPNLVGREIFPRAVALNTSTVQLSTIAGPAVGGAALSVSEGGVLAASGVMILLAAVAMASLRGIARPAVAAEAGGAWQTLAAGFDYICRNRLILGAVSLDMFAVLLGGATALLPIFARDILLAGPTELGLLRSAPAVGATLVGLSLAHRSLGRRAGWTMLGCVGLFGLSVIVFAYSRNLYLSLAALAVMGGADMVSVVIRHTMVQLSTPDNMRGRVAAVTGIFIGTSNDLGEFRAGFAAEWFGAVRAAALGGVGTLLVVAAWARLFPELRRADRFEDLTNLVIK